MKSSRAWRQDTTYRGWMGEQKRRLMTNVICNCFSSNNEFLIKINSKRGSRRWDQQGRSPTVIQTVQSNMHSLRNSYTSKAPIFCTTRFLEIFDCLVSDWREYESGSCCRLLCCTAGHKSHTVRYVVDPADSRSILRFPGGSNGMACDPPDSILFAFFILLDIWSLPILF